jgi:hypothetical protein
MPFQNMLNLLQSLTKLPQLWSQLCFQDGFCRHGLPLEIVSDNGKEFCNEIVDTFMKLMDIKKTNTTPNHLQTNTQAEVCNKYIAACLKNKGLSSTLDWEQYIAPMMFAYNTSYLKSIICRNLMSQVSTKQSVSSLLMEFVGVF